MLPCLQQRKEGVCLLVKVQPRAARNEIGDVLGNELKIKVTAPPVDSAANEAVLELLAGVLGCGRNRLHLARGQSSSHKQILVQGMALADVEAKLANA